MADIAARLEREVQALEERLAQNEKKFVTDWTTEELSKLTTNVNNSHKAAMKTGQGKIMELEALIKNHSSLHNCNVKELEERVQKLTRLRDELRRQTKETDDMVRNRECKEGDIAECVDRISSQQQELSTRMKGNEETLEKFNTVVETYKQSLGLRFKKTPGGKMQFIFTEIDRNDPETPFFFFVKVEGDDRKYTVTDCDPPVPDLPVLVDKLNATNNLKSFIVAMRKRFVQSVKQNAATK